MNQEKILRSFLYLKDKEKQESKKARKKEEKPTAFQAKKNPNTNLVLFH